MKTPKGDVKFHILETAGLHKVNRVLVEFLLLSEMPYYLVECSIVV